jgi:nanoRNase/pAp phosphatase (c-di-AMP/oligoRNAs hydrolase)
MTEILPTVPTRVSINNNHNTFIPGTFQYIKSIDANYKIMLVNAYQAITQTDTWNFVKKDHKSFMFSNDSRINLIYNKMEELGYSGHSGASFGWIMRNMRYIAQNGEEKFMEDYLSGCQ